MNEQQINDWEPETRALLEALVAAGCTLLSGNNGGDEEFKFEGDMSKFIEDLTAADDAQLYVRCPGSDRIRWIYLVFGNNPGELVSDYTVDPVLDAVSEKHYETWSEIPQPKTVRNKDGQVPRKAHFLVYRSGSAYRRIWAIDAGQACDVCRAQDSVAGEFLGVEQYTAEKLN